MDDRTLPQRITNETIQEAPRTLLALDKIFVGKLSGATPSVMNQTRFKGSNAGAVTVTQFKNGQEGQTIKILGDGNMTIQNGTNIITNTAADKLLELNVIYTFTLVETIWYENEAGSGGAGAVSSVFGRTGAVIAASGDYDAFYYTEAEVDALLAAIDFPVDSVLGRTGTVIATAGDYDAFYYTEAEVDALIAAISGNTGGHGGEHVGTTDIEIWYAAGAQGNEALSSSSFTAGVIRAIPFIAPARGGTLDRIACELLVGVAANNLRIGIYEPKGANNVYPGALVADSGDISSAALGFKSFTLSASLTAGKVYWFVLFNSATLTMRTLTKGGYQPFLGFAGAAAPAQRTYLTATLAYTALPNPFPSGAGTTNSSAFPLLQYRFSA